MPADPTYPLPQRRGPTQEASKVPKGPKAKRRLNTSSKGAHVELLAIKLLEADGYKVHRCVRTGQKRGPIYVSQSNDVFGCIDLVAKKLGERTRWVQVTADSGIGRKRREMAEVPWDPRHDSVEIWRWVGGNRRRHKGTGAWLDRQYFQVYHHDEGYELRKDRRIPIDDRRLEGPLAARLADAAGPADTATVSAGIPLATLASVLGAGRSLGGEA